MKKRSKLLALMATFILALVIGCADEAPPAKKSGSGSADGETGDSASFSEWCSKASQTDIVKGKLKNRFKVFCDGGSPTKLFKTTLTSDYLYKGSGTPRFKKIENWLNDKEEKTTTANIATAIKINISCETHFKKVAAKQGDKKALEEGGTFPENADVEVEILKKHSSGGEHYVRGWDIETKAETKTAGQKITIHTISRVDQFELTENKLYMYTSYVTDGIKQIRATDMLSSCIPISSNKAYLINTTYVVAENKTLHNVAITTLKETIENTIKAMYTVAQKAAGSSSSSDDEDDDSSSGSSNSNDDNEDDDSSSSGSSGSSSDLD